jgi:hypothetical protein
MKKPDISDIGDSRDLSQFKFSYEEIVWPESVFLKKPRKNRNSR